MNGFAIMKAELQRVLGPNVGIGLTDPKSADGGLMPSEEAAMVRAVEKRRLEFASGRIAARHAMSALGHPPAAVPMAQDRSPIWPDGLVGSITHCDDVCIAAVAHADTKRSIGIDVELSTPLNSEIENVVCTPSEQAWLTTQLPKRRGSLVKQIFCIKESVYKALYPITRRMVDFHELEISFPIDNTSYVTLKTENRTDRLNIESKSLAIGCHIFAYASLIGNPSFTLNGNGSYR